MTYRGPSGEVWRHKNLNFGINNKRAHVYNWEVIENGFAITPFHFKKELQYMNGS